MIYNGANPLHIEQAIAMIKRFARECRFFELICKQEKRSLSQNAYLHAALGYFGLQVGETLEYVKQYYYKKVCNPDLYPTLYKKDKITGENVELPMRSSASLDKGEMSLSIERFRNWAAANGVYIPSPEEHRAVMEMQAEVERGARWL